MHARERHFANGGCNSDSPNYIYYDKLAFLTEFSIKKDYQEAYGTYLDDLVPEFLISDENDGGLDYTSTFLQEIQKHPALFDSSAEQRKYRGATEWKSVAESLGNRFTTALLRDYWIKLMGKYKLWNCNREHVKQIANEEIFHEMSFGPIESIEEHIVEDDDGNEQITYEFEEESSVGQYEEVSCDKSFEDFQDATEQEPPAKRIKTEATIDEQSNLDEFDYFAKKVALQLKKISSKSQKSARKAEIEILQLLMDYEENT